MNVQRQISFDATFLAPGVADIPRWAERLGQLILTAAVFYLLAYAAGVILVSVSGQMGGEARQVDFVAFWGAGKLALAGDPVAAFDPDAHRAAQMLPSDVLPGDMLWLYPPGLQLIFVPFAMAPYWAAWFAWGALSMIAFAWAGWRFAASVPLGQVALIAAPEVIAGATYGQVTLLWAATLVLAFHQLARGRGLLAGVLIGALSLKPQLGLLLPVFMIAAGRWDVLIGAVLGAVLVHGLPTLVVGLDYWAAFFERMEAVTAALDTGGMPHPLMVTPYAFLRMLDLTHGAAIGVQIAVTCGLIAMVFVAWRRAEANTNLALGLLLMAIPVATPYAFYYELAIVVPAAIFMVRGGYGATWVEWALLGLAIFGPVILFPFTDLSPLFAPVVLTLCVHGFLRFRSVASAAQSSPA